MQSLATKNRSNQIVILVAIAFLFYELTNWQEGIWVAISAVVVAGPFSTFLSFEKARNRFLGTLVGLMIAACLEYYLRFNPYQLPLIAVLIAMCLAFLSIKDYKYMVIAITVCTCLGFTYMNMPFTSFEPMDFLISRGMGVFVGILIFYVLQRFLFKSSSAKLELTEEANNCLAKIKVSVDNYLNTKTTKSAFEEASNIMIATKDLKGYYNSSDFVFAEKTKEAIYSKKIITISDRVIKELINTQNVNINQIEKIKRIVELKIQKENCSQ